ncbi:MAG: class I SAM-dependent methyltransferase [Gammaproteobacteria bacterium]|nr:class I SAM-dependent methyltransferase [Gammaproteobacteria bacterium]
MTALAERLCRRYFAGTEHPYDAFEREVARSLRRRGTLVDAGCGRSAPVLVKFRGRAARLIGIDVVAFTQRLDGLELYQRDLAHTGLQSGSVDVVMARSVMEHIPNPLAVYAEIARVLRPGGRFVFLTANLWDYASLIAAAVPNRLHPWIVAHTEGRREEDVFPIQYRSNTRRAIRRAAAASALRIERFEYLGQYPAYFMFNGALFLLATGYERLIAAARPLHCLRGWILCTLRKDPALLR